MHRHDKLFLAGFLLAAFSLASADLPRIEKREHGYQLLVNGKPFIILGGQVNNSSGWAAVLPDIWKTYDGLGANTVEIPVYWEAIEPQQGEFQFENVDRILASA